jgi:regulator of sirC expression with transglutaminase-like and TPR domain
MDFNPAEIVQKTGTLPDPDINPAHAALALAAFNHPGISIGRYLSHLEKLSSEVAARFKILLDEGADDDAGARLASLQYVLADKEGYIGDRETYDHLDNADLMRVIDRRKGLPVALAILYIYAAREQGWDVYALNFPGHVLCRIETGSQRLIFDPFERCKLMEAHDLRALVKRVAGPDAELSTDYYGIATNREIVIRLQNNIKLRQVEMADYEGALTTVERMRQIDPDEFRLLLDEGVLSSRTGRRGQAITALEAYINQLPPGRDRQEAAVLLRQVQEMPD